MPLGGAFWGVQYIRSRELLYSLGWKPGQLAESSSGSSPSLTSLDGSLYQTKSAVLVTIRSVGYMEAEILDLVGSISLPLAYFGAVCPSLPKP